VISHHIQRALEREVIGQPRAIATLVRAATVGLSPLGGRDGPLGTYLFMGPSGTGKTHMARVVARLLHASVAVIDCVQVGNRDDWSGLVRQLMPHLASTGDDATLALPPRSVVLVEHVEAAKPEAVKALLSALESGCLVLPDGKRGGLRECLVLLTTALCAREVYGADRQEIGFSSASAEQELTEKARIYQLCSAAAERAWGSDVLGHLDDLIVFHRLWEAQLPFILRRLMLELNGRLRPLRVSCLLEPEAAAFVLGRGGRFMRHGAWYLVKVFRRFVLFPIADLLASGRLSGGGRVRISPDSADRLRFDVIERADPAPEAADEPFRVPVAWDDATVVAPS
jgi:ATP-dependent Clp protease ATP-binding subunit ClpC